VKRSASRGRSMPAEPRRTIVLWGGVNSGKSGLIGALRGEATKSVGDRWAIDVDDASPEVVAYADSSSLALRLRGVKETTIRRAEPAFTVPVRRYEGRRVSLTADLTVLDPRGELAADPGNPLARRTLAAGKTADAILWLLEAPVPGAVPAPARLPLLRQLVALLDAAGAAQLNVPVVVALTKIDRLPVAEMRRVIDAPEEALRSALGDAAFGWLLAAFPRMRCFGFSAAGTVRNAVRPIGLTSMIDWFADEWRREEQQADAARRSARISARVARVRGRAPFVATMAAAAAIIAFAGVAAARLLGQRAQTWSSSAGTIVTPRSAARDCRRRHHRESDARDGDAGVVYGARCRAVGTNGRTHGAGDNPDEWLALRSAHRAHRVCGDVARAGSGPFHDPKVEERFSNPNGLFERTLEHDQPAAEKPVPFHSCGCWYC